MYLHHLRLCCLVAGDFSLSVLYRGQIQHFKVLRDYKGRYFLWEKMFDSLNQLINHHQSVSVSKTETIFLREMEEVENPQTFYV